MFGGKWYSSTDPEPSPNFALPNCRDFIADSCEQDETGKTVSD
jgi:hypothetical protein